MANTTVNQQITDSIAQTTTVNLGVVPALSLDQLYVTVSMALGNAAHNATYNQQQMNITAQAVTTMGATMLYSINTATTEQMKS